MLSEVYYLVRSQSDGRYLTARPNAEASGYLLLFRENYDALSYLNTHAAEVANRFAVESIAGTQVGNLVKRWGFSGVGIVTDPLLPKVEFLQHS
ncbi:hypothetical protein [Cylindrospermum sp. FACHB-282]|uniref:hypothetical protein n=1 Tax=Cylindrospermum sp. FACHB-282 TaxID=2692794 RepID=UPI000B5F583E|nr:hypothetical protein [Cylindrospermum sp. FACHB-282]MBD2387358.1 hypothetical protein [Cylindrospermum sp. FACHB-282]BAZ30069.1 hypothetical protein NIES4074_25250 [Cylindrospermum sp. NIES-4074]